MSDTVVITGANRGIGLAFCKHYHARGAKVYAVCRQASAELSALGVTIIDQVDVSQPSDMERLQGALAGRDVDILINNAGILRSESLAQLNFDTIQAQFETNTLAPLRVTMALLPQLKVGSKVANITSRMGSISDNSSGGFYGYRMSKAALNAASMSLSRDLAPEGIAVAILHPGLVGTDMIGGRGDVTPEQAAESLIERIDQLTMENSGTFWHARGEVLPW